MISRIPSISLAFLIAGLPILFILREYLPLPKTVFTYGIITIILLLLINLKKLLILKLHSSIPLFINIMLFVLLFIFLTNIFYDDMVTKKFSDSIYIFIILFVFIALFSRTNLEFNYFFKFVLLFSSITTILTLISTPLNLDYWYSIGSRLYVGDTKNPNISSFTALINIISIIFYFYINEKINIFKKIIFFILITCSFYIYYLSFSKSAILGLFLVLLFIFPFNSLKSKKFYRNTIFIIFISILSLSFFPSLIDNILLKIEVLFSSFYSYFFGITENIARDSAAIRHQRLKEVLPILFTVNLLSGNGILTTRADFPILQVFTDLGYFAGILNLFLMLLYPLYIIFKSRNYLKKIKEYPNEIFVLLIYIFNIPNFIWHGTPYETSVWLPILLILKINILERK